MRGFWVCSTWLLTAAPAVAQSDVNATADTIVAIRVEGLRRVDREAALQGVRMREGAPLDRDAVTEDLKTLWKTGFFSDIQISQEPADGGLRVVISVVEKPSIREVRYEGNDAISDDDIKEVVNLKPFTILNEELIKGNVTKIKDLCLDKGFYLADVSYRVLPVAASPHEVDVVFTIVENAKVQVKQINIVGNHALSDEDLKNVLQTREGGELSWLTQSGTYKEEHFQTDLFRMQALYYDHGYVAVKMGEPVATISKDRRYIYLSVAVDEGAVYAIGDIRFSGEVELKGKAGKVIIDEQLLRAKLQVKTGDMFNRTKLFQDIQVLTDAYRDEGYAYANVTPNSALRDAEQRVDLDLEVERGEVVTIDRIEIVGNTRTRDKVIRREMRIHEGDRYSATLIQKSKARIYQLGFFETVEIATSKGVGADTMNLTVEVKERSTGTFQVGAGFSSVESFIFNAQISQNNFLGNGQVLSLMAQLSFGDFGRQIATVQFHEPYFLDSLWSFGVNAYWTTQLYLDFQREARGIAPTFGYPITPDLRVSAGYTLEDIKLTTDFGGLTSGTALYNLNRDGRVSSVNASLAYDTRDNRLFPSSGQYHLLMGEVSHPGIGSEAGLAYNRLQLFGRYYQRLPLSFVLKFNGELGYVFGGGSHGVPISERFFPGGIYSVRGFEPRGLGPTVRALSEGDPASNSSTFVIGGNKQAIFNLELEFPILEMAGIKGVLFADAGNAYSEDEGFFYIDTPKSRQPDAHVIRSGAVIKPPLGLYYSTGFGFRWFSPIGPLRFEWGIPLTKRDADDRGRIFEFTIGNFF